MNYYRVQQPFDLTSQSVASLGLPNPDDNFIGKSAMISGWGTTEDNAPSPSKLMSAELLLIPDDGNLICYYYFNLNT